MSPLHSERVAELDEHRRLSDLARTIRCAILALGYAVGDIEAGHWTPAERLNLANTMDTLVAQLRDSTPGELNDRVVITSERTDR